VSTTLWVILGAGSAAFLLLAVAGFIAWRAQAGGSGIARRIEKLPLRYKIALGLALFRDRRVAWLPRVIGVLLVLYMAMPLDIIPDFIPVLGLLDDILIAGLGIWLLLRSVPREVIEDNVTRLESELAERRASRQEVAGQEGGPS
jgi:uncharacterized membrane protein YkvA (DUF1232 family)